METIDEAMGMPGAGVKTGGKVAMLTKLTCLDGKREAVYSAMQPMLDYVDQEEGTEIFQLLEDQNDPNVAYIYQVYRDAEARAAHGSSEVAREVMPGVRSLFVCLPETTVFAPVGGTGI